MICNDDICSEGTHILTVEYNLFAVYFSASPFIFWYISVDFSLFFGISALTFRCKPPLGASSPLISAVSAFIFRCKPPLGAAFYFQRNQRLFFAVSLT